MSEPSIETKPIDQSDIGVLSCGPCAVAHSQGKDISEAKEVLLKLLERKSLKFPNRRAYSPENGAFGEDLAALMRDRYGVKAEMHFCNRPTEEKNADFVRRIHSDLQKALQSGVRPISEIRSFECRPDGWEYKWFCTLGHFNVITWVSETLPENSLQFLVKFKDSLTGNEEEGYVYFEKYRNFTATRDFTVTSEGKIEWDWVTEYPYLCVTIPNIQLETKDLPYQARVVTVLRTLIY